MLSSNTLLQYHSPAPGDYALTSETVTFASGDISRNVSVSTQIDALVEGNEVFQASLSLVSPNDPVMLEDDVANATIQDISGKPVVISIARSI